MRIYNLHLAASDGRQHDWLCQRRSTEHRCPRGFAVGTTHLPGWSRRRSRPWPRFYDTAALTARQTRPIPAQPPAAPAPAPHTPALPEPDAWLLRCDGPQPGICLFERSCKDVKPLRWMRIDEVVHHRFACRQHFCNFTGALDRTVLPLVRRSQIRG